MDSISSIRPASHVASPNHHAPDRFDALRRDRMLVGSVLSWLQTLARIDRLAERCDEAERRVGQALEAMGRVAVETYQLEAEARTTAPHVPTPVDVLELSLPPISGGAPEFVPSEADWRDFYECRDAHLDERDVVNATGCC
jgi:hypothetical protein